MSHYYEISRRVTEILMTQFELKLPFLTEGFTKNALGATSNGIVLPYDLSFRGTYTQQYINTLHLHGLHGVSQWIEFIGVIQKSGWSLTEMTYGILEAFAVLYGINFSTWLIPCVKIQGAGQDKEVSTIYCHVTEYMSRNCITDFSDFIRDLLEIVLYGCPMRPGIVETLGLYNPGAYVASRLFQGTFECLGDQKALRFPGFISHFVDSTLIHYVDANYGDVVDTQDMETSINSYKAVQDGSKRIKLQQDIEETAARILTSTHWYLGTNEEDLLALSAKFTFSGMTGAYADYVQRQKCGKTMGYTLWEFISLGKSSEEDPPKEVTGDQIPGLWWNKIISTSVGL